MGAGIYWRPGKGGFSTFDDELHLLLSQIAGHHWYQWTYESFFDGETAEKCSLCGIDMTKLDHTGFEEHGRTHLNALNPVAVKALLTLLYMHSGQLAKETVQDLLGYDRDNAKEKFAFWGRTAQ